MAIFKYTVASKEGKKLSGTVEAPDEATARGELNNLGFSILSLKETKEMPKVDDSLTKFEFEALDKNSKLVSGTIPAESKEDALNKLSLEYALKVTAIWEHGATQNEIQAARQQGMQQFQEELVEQQGESAEEKLQHQKEEQFTKNKIENIIKEIYELLKSFDKQLSLAQKNEINKKINKLLRIKNSKNISYILKTAEDLLKFIQSQEKDLKEKGFQDKQLELEIKTRKMLDELNRSSKPKTISEDIIRKIENWEAAQVKSGGDKKTSTKILKKILLSIKNYFKTPPEILVIKEQIKVYNHQLWEFSKLYFKEPAKEYKQKVKNSLRTIWRARLKAVHSLKQAKKLLKQRRRKERAEEHLLLSFVEELNSLTGWLLAFYLIYYFVSLYLTTKNFGFLSVPNGFLVYESQIFKYILAILFLLHASTSVKLNFFKQSHLASLIIIPIFLFGSIIVLLNF